MPPTTRPSRTFAAACLLAATLLALLPGSAAALEPPRPLPGHRPTFVTETDTHPWTDCLWASGAMLLDKWTGGAATITRQELRALSGLRAGGASLEDLGVAYAKLGIDLAFSPDGGATIGWPQLLDRLEHGAGAVLLGDDSKLPRWFGRWDVSFWKGLGKNDHHAVYIERYDRANGRVWLMDPLGSGEWQGEWISVRALRPFVWTTRGGALSVAVTPAASAAPYAGVTLGAPTAAATATTLAVTWGLTTPRTWSFPGADVKAEFVPAVDPPAAAAIAPPVPAYGMPASAPAKTGAALSGPGLRAVAPLPGKPGAYQATVTLTDRRFGRVVARSADIAVFVPGPRRATLSVHLRGTDVTAGDIVPVSVSVANTGKKTWADDVWPAGVPMEATQIRDTHLVARWIPLDVPGVEAVARSGTAAATALPGADPVELGRIPLAPGAAGQVGGEIAAPDRPGTWALVVDVVDDVDGSFAALGSAPAVLLVEVVARQRIVPLE